jgi:hypothetical protein
MGSLLVSGCKKARKQPGVDGTDPDVTAVRPFGVDDTSWGGMPDRPADEGTLVAGEYAPVLFAYDSAHLSPEERPKADAVAETMRGSPGMRLVIEGHCDERGSREYNMALGEPAPPRSCSCFSRFWFSSGRSASPKSRGTWASRWKRSGARPAM